MQQNSEHILILSQVIIQLALISSHVMFVSRPRDVTAKVPTCEIVMES